MLTVFPSTTNVRGARAGLGAAARCRWMDISILFGKRLRAYQNAALFEEQRASPSRLWSVCTVATPERQEPLARIWQRKVQKTTGIVKIRSRRLLGLARNIRAPVPRITLRSGVCRARLGLPLSGALMSRVGRAEIRKVSWPNR